jgi:hypothetical protein
VYFGFASINKKQSGVENHFFRFRLETDKESLLVACSDYSLNAFVRVKLTVECLVNLWRFINSRGLFLVAMCRVRLK